MNLEKRAFAAFEGLYDNGAGNFTVRGKPNRDLAIQLLFNREYLAEKAAVVEPVQRFMDLFGGRMQTQSDSRLARLEQQIMTEMVLIFIALLATTGIVFYTRLGISNPSPNSAARWQGSLAAFCLVAMEKRRAMNWRS